MHSTASLVAFLFAIVCLPVTGQNARTAVRDTQPRPLNLIVINYDPVLTNHGDVRLSRHLKWNNPRPMTTNLIRYIRESSGGFANYRLVDWIDVDAFPQKRDGFRYTEESFLAMWKDKKKAHKPDSVSYAAIFNEHNLVERVKREDVGEIWIWGAPYFGT